MPVDTGYRNRAYEAFFPHIDYDAMLSFTPLDERIRQREQERLEELERDAETAFFTLAYRAAGFRDEEVENGIKLYRLFAYGETALLHYQDVADALRRK